jgi:hypothetical protein
MSLSEHRTYVNEAVGPLLEAAMEAVVPDGMRGTVAFEVRDCL